LNGRSRHATLCASTVEEELMDATTARRFQVVGIVFIVVGLVSAGAALPALGVPIGIMADITFWPIDGSPGAPALPTERLFAAIAGGLMTGWGAMLLLLGRGVSVARAFLLGGVAWFVVDGTGSVLAGVPLNVLGNLPFLALIVWAAWPGLLGRRAIGSGNDGLGSRDPREPMEAG
jgi:hypothetical protein